MNTHIRHLGILAVLVPALAGAQSADTTVTVTVGGFVDTYYAYDFGRPPTLDRSFAGGATFLTQPARHNEFNINLAYLEANLAGDRMHGRFALQAGTAVQSNYAGEPTRGGVSGPGLSRMIQEAFGGYQVSPSLWIDAGVFYSHMGMESWASKDNPTYTRSLVAEYSPYYSSGVRAVWTASPKLTVRVDAVNGWQNVSETNTDKGIGARLDFAATPTLSVSYYDFFNDEVGSRLRVFNGAGVKVAAGKTTLLGQVDVGSLGAPSAGGSSSTWWGFTAIARRQVTPMTALSGRFEMFNDEDQVTIATGLADPFRGSGASVGVDVTPRSRIMWRTEARGFFADATIFPDGPNPPKKSGVFAVSSLSLIF